MSRIKFLSAAAGLVAGLTLSGAASAAPVFDVTVWTGANDGVNSSQQADSADTPTGTAVAHFTYSGPIDWTNLATQNSTTAGNLVKDFISASDQALISSWTGPTGLTETQWLNSSLSVAGNSVVSFFKIVGTYTSGSPQQYAISHDDGASVYDSGGNPLYSSPNETSQITGNFTLAAGSNSTFTVDYVEGNGSPSVLNVTAIPEPATWAMMLLGVFGIGAMLRSRRSLQPRLAA